MSLFNNNFSGFYLNRSNKRKSINFLILGALNIILSIIMFITYFNYFNININYNKTINKDIYLPKGKYYLYIKMNFNQADIDYYKSISFDQLKGNTDIEIDKEDKYQFLDNKVIYPLGKLPYTYYQDTIKIKGVNINSSKIVFPSDKNLIKRTKYKLGDFLIPGTWDKNTNKGTVPLNTKKPNYPILNERFINWILISSFSDSKKLWGTFQIKNKGNYNLEIKGKDPVNKEIFITRNSWLGYKNNKTMIILLILGILSIAMSFIIKMY